MGLFVFICLLICCCNSEIKCASPVNIEFVVDGSTSISSGSFSLMKDFLLNMTSSFTISSNAAEFGVTQFAGSVKYEIRLSSSASDVQEAISTMTQIQGGTDMGTGLEYAQSDLMKNTRKNAKKISVLLTDGQPSGSVNPVEVAKNMKGNGIEIFCVGVGSGVDEKILTEIASLPSTEHVFPVEDFSSLQRIRNELAFKSCVKIEKIKPSSGPTNGGTAVIIR